MKPKTDAKKQPLQTINPALSRRRLKAFMERLKEQPELLGQFESILQLATDAEALGRTADEIESLLLEATRKLGNSTMRHWALGAQARAIAACEKVHPKARLKKKAP